MAFSQIMNTKSFKHFAPAVLVDHKSIFFMKLIVLSSYFGSYTTFHPYSSTHLAVSVCSPHLSMSLSSGSHHSGTLSSTTSAKSQLKIRPNPSSEPGQWPPETSIVK